MHGGIGGAVRGLSRGTVWKELVGKKESYLSSPKCSRSPWMP